ncbi:hypothetical protein DP43_3540 [Burkholderia pseudomallei]|nr:hypothetical protein DP43_3540 [Burkholderia pseudomallei]
MVPEVLWVRSAKVLLQCPRYVNDERRARQLSVSSSSSRSGSERDVTLRHLNPNGIERCPRAWPVYTQTILEPEQRTMMRAHQYLIPVAQYLSGFEIERHRKMRTAVDITPDLLTTPHNHNRSAS